MRTVTDDDDDEMQRQPRDILSGLIIVTGTLCAVLLIVGALGLA
jgi:hypothetical protein